MATLKCSLMIEGQDGLTWPHWKRLVAETEDLGFAGLFRSDHFTNAQPPDKASLEMIVSLTYLADHTQRLHFGPLVAPVSFRHPTLLARQAAALDDLSGGRMILGVGAGWQEREHRLFGHELGDIPTRMQRLEEALEVITRLLNSDEPVSYSGRFFQLDEATLLPRPQRPGGPPILIGGNGARRTLPLVARYARIWNGLAMSPEEFREHGQKLDALLSAGGRQPSEVKRTLMLTLFFGRDQAELEKSMAWRLRDPKLAGLSLDEAVRQLVYGPRPSLAGSAEQILARLQEYAEAGVEEVMLQWFDIDDLEGLRAFGKSVVQRL
ncbi:MAG TPA: TIGR03560 family F420-dependent LLM class oxidoreductase [Ktedonobacteraceae bacterium]|nr:TIGR03560 family F420-dependent LLM class oxidoreductase [Ktedonobacteraceae bacterium]